MGVFDDKIGTVFTTYDATIKLRDRLMGGTPKDPKIIEGWLRSKTGVTDAEEIRQMMLRTLMEVGAEVRADMGYDELVTASETVAGNRNATGFKVGAHGLYVEGRQIKAMLKESVNVLYAGLKWGKTNKGPRNFFAERVFVDPDQIWLGREDHPDGSELFIGHVSGADGPKSTLTYHEYVIRPTMRFSVIVLRNLIEQDYWPEIWLHAQENGVGALRSQGYGRFDIEDWREVPTDADRLRRARVRALQHYPEEERQAAERDLVTA